MQVWMTDAGVNDRQNHLRLDNISLSIDDGIQLHSSSLRAVCHSPAISPRQL